MSIEQVSGTDLTYHLICHDKDGQERTNDPDGVMSERAQAVVRETPVTDVFIASHGWKGDIPAAQEQYNAWIGAMAKCTQDRQRILEKHSDYKPLIIGFHWPSQPWGDEEFGGPATAFATTAAGGCGSAAPRTAEDAIESFVDLYADRIADTPAARTALRTIFEAAAKGSPQNILPPDVANAYAVLASEAGVASGGIAGAPGADAEKFDAAKTFQNARAPAVVAGLPAGVAFGGFGLSGILSPLRQLSFWKMKDRARSIGESAGFTLLRALEDAVPGERRDKVRFHLMGHSFGCIVVSSMLNGPQGQGRLSRPVDSLTLVQGALSLWAYCDKIPQGQNKPGYFNTIVKQGKVKGPIVTTRSKRDTAVGKFYPIAAGVALQVAFGPDEFPTYGGLGAFGIQGSGLQLRDAIMQADTFSYGFAPGEICNLECTQIIKEGTGASGAHSDIAKTEVAHAMWDAVIGS